MKKLRLFKYDSQIKLTDQAKDESLSEEIINKYSMENNPFINELDKYELFETHLSEINEDRLDINNDFETAKYLYETLKLDRIQASDERLWTTLTHLYSWNYMQKRWNLSTSRKDTNLQQKILSRWHLSGSTRTSLARNGLSRLWWSAYLTYAPWLKDEKFECFKSNDPYKYTRILSEENKSQAIVDVLEREFTGSLLFRICFLEAYNILIDKIKLKPTLASAKLSALFNGLLIPRSVSAHKEDPQDLVDKIVDLQEHIKITNKNN